MLRCLLLTLLLSLCIGDTYLEMPRGSNNRLNENSANRRNANRMFDSQNNNRGGYNAADLHRQNGFNAYGTDDQLYNIENRAAWADGDAADRYQYEPLLKEKSIYRITWKAQHGCGNEKNNCNMVFEWTCDSCDVNDENCIRKAGNDVDGMRVQLMNGLNTGTSNDANGLQNVKATHNTNRDNERGLHESEEYYAIAKNRERNKGLFTADQKVHGNKQINTRQNPGGTRRGQEVPEERDYYPWTHPTIWRSALIFHNNVTECEEKMAKHSQNVEEKCACIPAATANQNAAWTQDANTVLGRKCEQDCVSNKKIDCETGETDANTDQEVGKWKCHKWDLPKPKCVQAAWSQVNNLGNVENTGEGGLPQHYDWELPSVQDMIATGCHQYTWNGDAGNGQNYAGPGATKKYVRFVMRNRYNMTVGDFAPYETFSTCNQNSKAQRQSPIQQNPTVDIGVEMQGLRLAINTAQTGRTFQDRSHVHRLTQAAADVPIAANKRLWNLNVQGKRGNIVQTFPANEYDFWPRTLELQVGDCVDFQWVGSNTHNNGNPAGDGQAGDAGEGRGGSDRHNMAQLYQKDESYPMPLDITQTRNNVEVKDWISSLNCYDLAGNQVDTGAFGSNDVTKKDAQIYLMSGGFYTGYADIEKQEKDDQDDNNGASELNVLLNNVAASMRPLTCCTTANSVGEFFFTNTRNNNFSNRDQKLTVKVGTTAPALKQGQGRKPPSATIPQRR